MEYVKKSEDGNIERVYEISFDTEKLNKLLNEIIRKTGYKEVGTFKESCNYQFVDDTFITNPRLPNGDYMYVDVQKIYRVSNHLRGPYDMYKDAIMVEGTKIVVPELAHIISGILMNEPDSIYMLLNYLNNEELISIDEQIASVDNEINNLSYYDFDKRIEALKHLKALHEARRDMRFFDVELLKEYYDQVLSLLELQLIKETSIKKGKRIKLSDLNRDGTTESFGAWALTESQLERLAGDFPIVTPEYDQRKINELSDSDIIKK